MSLTAYTTYAAIRAALGVSSKELTDAVLGTEIYEYELLRELRAIDAGLPADFATVAAVAEPRPTVSQNLYEAVRLFAAYNVANHCLSVLPLFSPKAISDGKASLSRHTFEDAVARVESLFIRLRKSLIDAYAVYNGGTATDSYSLPPLTSSSPDYDPVIGE